jgi:hypothetical protein
LGNDVSSPIVCRQAAADGLHHRANGGQRILDFMRDNSGHLAQPRQRRLLTETCFECDTFA